MFIVLSNLTANGWCSFNKISRGKLRCVCAPNVSSQTMLDAIFLALNYIIQYFAFAKFLLGASCGYLLGNLGLVNW